MDGEAVGEGGRGGREGGEARAASKDATERQRARNIIKHKARDAGTHPWGLNDS